jgi:non-heme chloroperoxidase
MPFRPLEIDPFLKEVHCQKFLKFLANSVNKNTGSQGGKTMSMHKTKDGTQIFYKDWGTGQPIVFSHGWPLSADAWDAQMMFLGKHGFRVIAHDRRSHGRSDQTWDGNDMDTYADDLAGLIASLDLHNAVLIGHSTGGGEVARYIGRHGTTRVAKAVLVGAITPLMLKTASNPGGLPIEAFDSIRKNTLENRTDFFKDLSMAFYGYNREGATISEGARNSFWLQGMQAGIKGAYDCIKQFSETDLTEDLKKMTIPTLIVHGDERAAEIAPQAILKVYQGAPHGLTTTHQDQLNADLLAFIHGKKIA